MSSRRKETHHTRSRWKFIRIFPVAAIALLSLTTTTHAERIDSCVTLADSLLSCYTYLTNDSVEPRALVITLPMLSRDRTSYDKIVDELSSHFPEISFLNFDLRGHGQSVSIGSTNLSYKDMERSEYPKIPDDIRESLRLIRKVCPELKKTPVIIIGASIGANSAGILANIEKSVVAACLLSPGLNYREIIPGPHLAVVGEKQILMMVGTQDTYSFNSTDSLFALSEGVKTQLTYNTGAHGTNIPNNSDSAMVDLVDWTRQTLESIKSSASSGKKK
ncbi:MAG: alpha/beta hydrolase [candidate division Zixibacteria bacterium]|nr:alpha/beta hydrolase [candidate division Zixibacteria bacterium]